MQLSQAFDPRAIQIKQLERIRQLLSGLAHGGLKPATRDELAALLGWSASKEDAVALKRVVTAHLRAERNRARSRAATTSSRATGHPESVDELERQLREAGVRHPINRKLAVELFSTKRRVKGAFRELSPLKLLNYEVGARGEGPRVRREILEDFVCVFVIPKRMFESEYRASWGEPGTQKRKRQTEASLRRFATLNGARLERESAVADWRSDLKWLRGSRLDKGALVGATRGAVKAGQSQSRNRKQG